MRSQVRDADVCSPLENVGDLELNPCGLVANSLFNDVVVVGSAPEPYDPLLPYDYMDESGISWVTGEISNRKRTGSTHVVRLFLV